MEMAFMLGTTLAVYIFLVYKITHYIKNKYIWQADEMIIKKAPQWNLIAIVVRVMNFFLALFYVIIIFWPPLIVVMAISQSHVPTWGFDVRAFAGFSLDLNALSGIEATGLRQPEIHGKALITFDTSNLYAWYLFVITRLVSTMAALFVVLQLRAMVMSVQSGLSFSPENALRIKRIGMVTIVWNLVMPLVQYFGWGAFINDISINTSGIQFEPAFEFDVFGLVVGLLLLVLSGILTEAAEISSERELTI